MKIERFEAFDYEYMDQSTLNELINKTTTLSK